VSRAGRPGASEAEEEGMPEYLAPGVYVEEVPYRSKSIEGVSTTTTGFVGPTRYGPVNLEPELITSLGEFERIFGDGRPLEFADAGRMTNFVWQATRAFFEEGGKRLYVVRTFRERRDPDDPTVVRSEGFARGWLPVNDVSTAGQPGTILVRARFPGAAGSMRVRITVRLGQNVLGSNENGPTLGALQPGDVVWITERDPTTDETIPGSGRAYQVETFFDADRGRAEFRFSDRATPTPTVLTIAPTSPPDLQPGIHRIQVVTLTVSVFSDDPEALPAVWSDLPLDPLHERFGVRDSFSELFAPVPPTLAQARSLPIVVRLGANRQTGLAILDAINAFSIGRVVAALDDFDSSDEARSIDLPLGGGDDGDRPLSSDYQGEARLDRNTKTGLKALEDIDDISIVAAPGSTFQRPNDASYQAQVAGNLNALITHATNMKYRIAVLDSSNGQSIQDVRAQRAKIDSKYAAFYYPWVRIVDAITGREADMPPSGFVAGIYARNDIERAVYKAPANEVVNLAVGFEHTLNKAQQDVLNPEGINCFRYFEGRGFRLWGARTISSDPEWKYVNLRRYFIYLEHSIDKGTQWAVFEPNGDLLWANVRRTIEDFLLNEWQMGALLGDKPEKAFFVRCDRTTMTQNDLDNGRLVCRIGVAPLRPAEFVIFRIGQWTADRRA
jgi:phage tail sheath protein FI